MEDLTTPTALLGFPGAPFSASVVKSAGGSIRDECSWHIAPIAVQTVRILPSGGLLFLRTMKLLDVISVTDRDGNDVEVDDFDEGTGIVSLNRAPRGRVAVEFEHGYEECPPALLSVVAERAARFKAGIARQESLGSRSIAVAASHETTSDEVIARYRLGGRP